MSPPSAAITAGVSAVLLVLGLGRLLAAAAPGRRPGRAGGARRRCDPLARHPRGRDLARRLGRAGVPLGPTAFAAAVAAAAGLSAAATAWALGMPLLAPAPAGLVVVGAAALLRSGDGRRLARMAEQLPRVTQELAAALGAGLSLRQALLRTARDAPAPLAGELRAVVDELRLGARMESALEGLAERVPVRDVRVLVTAILVQRRTGGDLARALAVLADRLDERTRLARELRGATAQARLTAWLVAALPVAAGAMAEVAAPGTVREALGRPPGPLLLAVSAAMYAAGVAWVRRIGRVEP